MLSSSYALLALIALLKVWKPAYAVTTTLRRPGDGIQVHRRAGSEGMAAMGGAKYVIIDMSDIQPQSWINAGTLRFVMIGGWPGLDGIVYRVAPVSHQASQVRRQAHRNTCWHPERPC